MGDEKSEELGTASLWFFSPAVVGFLQNAKIRPHSTKTRLCYKGGFLLRDRGATLFTRPKGRTSHSGKRHAGIVLITEDAGLPLTQKPPCASTMLGTIRPEPPAKMELPMPFNAIGILASHRGTGSKAFAASTIALRGDMSNPVAGKERRPQHHATAPEFATLSRSQVRT